MGDFVKHQLVELSDRSAVIVNPETGERSVAYGDGSVLPFGAAVREEVFKLASRHLLSPHSNVTVLSPQELSGLTGALLARQSRVNGSVVDVLAKEFLRPDGTVDRAKAQALIERVLLQFGDDSVQEYEYATVLFISVSNLATKMIEDRRLAAYIEQSSRYVAYTQRDPVSGAWRYYREPRIIGSSLGVRYVETMDRCFAVYAQLSEMLASYYAQLKPRDTAEYAIRPGESRKLSWSELASDEERKEFERVYKTDLKTRACDTARVVLPAATLTNMAMVGNGRVYEHLLKKLYSSDSPEFLDIAGRLHETLNKFIPQYVARAKAAGDDYQRKIRLRTEEMATTFSEMRETDKTEEVSILDLPKIISKDPSGVNAVLASVFYPYARCSYNRLLAAIETAGKGGRNIAGLLGYVSGGDLRMSRRDRMPRAWETGYPLTVEVSANFGIFRDLHRHRMMTLERQALTPFLGFTVPKDIEAIGMGEELRRLSSEVGELYLDLERELGVGAAEYCTLFGHDVRFKMGMNLREAEHLLELRTIPQGHPDYRRVCQKIAKEILARAPFLKDAGLLKFVDFDSYDWARAASEARQSQKAAEKGIKI